MSWTFWEKLSHTILENLSKRSVFEPLLHPPIQSFVTKYEIITIVHVSDGDLPEIPK